MTALPSLLRAWPICPVKSMYAYERASLSSRKYVRNLTAVSEAASQVTCTESVNLDNDLTRHCAEGRIHEALILLSTAVEQALCTIVAEYSTGQSKKMLSFGHP